MDEPTAPYRVVIYDDDPTYLNPDQPFQRILSAYGWDGAAGEGTFRLFRKGEGKPNAPVFEVVGATKDADRLVGIALHRRADLILYDLHLGGLHKPQDHATLELLPRLVEDASVVIHTNSMAGATLPEVGAQGIVRSRMSKGEVTDEFVAALVAAARGEHGRDHLSADLAESVDFVKYVVTEMAKTRPHEQQSAYTAWLKFMLAGFSANLSNASILDKGPELVPEWFWEENPTKADRTAAITERKRSMVRWAMKWGEQHAGGWDQPTATQNLFAAVRGLPLA